MSYIPDFHKIKYFTEKFKEYYQNNYISCILDVSKREFGIGTIQSKISQRHLSFVSLEDFNNYLRITPPFYVSYSTSYFKYPDRRPMDNKIWEGSDIVYEFDSDDYDLPCHDRHNTWQCTSEECNEWGYGNLVECPKCFSKTKITEWTCDECLGKAKEDTLRLVDFLEKEFKLNPASFIISFSGAKGYHVRITDRTIISLSKPARLQMMNYILANDLELEKLGFIKQKKLWKIPPVKEAAGWSKKIIMGIIDVFSYDEKKLINLFGLSPKKAKLLKDTKEDILNKMYHNNILVADFSSSDKFFEDVINHVINKTRLKIDPQSSSDIFKIMRVPDTIHGGTGFLSTYIKTKEDLINFDPFKDPVVLGNMDLKKIKLLKPTPKFRIIDQYYGPYNKDEVLKLPEKVSMFLVLKGVANFE
ncbi:MAG: DNA primase small subunit domain-containing protein [Candidatus ainarchaeum sp.]|nr:DNA primase small subunit domain-containing protein [Candidatus ainarchaeum sp.]